MLKHEFLMTFMIPGYDGDLLDPSDALYEAGCSDCTISVRNKLLEIEFSREAETYEAAVSSALANVLTVLPTAVQRGPTLAIQWRPIA